MQGFPHQFEIRHLISMKGPSGCGSASPHEQIRQALCALQALKRDRKAIPCKLYLGVHDYHSTTDGDHPHKLFEEQMEEMKREREALFGFTEDDHNAWSNLGNDPTKSHDVSLMQAIHKARTETDSLHENQSGGMQVEQHPSGLTHVSKDGASVHMVDVGAKEVTQRRAVAQSKVVFPTEVIKAFEGQDDWIGPKGPIFATAKLAGIMAAKKTSDLIPLCHPLPLDQVTIDIQFLPLVQTAVIHCECKVTHKTGVEMEALTGATVAALTIYDMVKALSHNVRIEETILLEKSGGKRTVGTERE